MIALFAAGCGSGVGDVIGHVTYNKRPVISGTVMLLASDGQPYDGAIDSAGNYRNPQGAGGAGQDRRQQHPADREQGTPGIQGSEGREEPTPVGLPAWPRPRYDPLAKTSAIPSRFGNFAASSLAIIVASGETRHDIELGD